MNKKMTEAQFKGIAYRLNCDPAVLDAVFQVESRGTGFDKKDRPKILFEKHVFYRELPKDKRRLAVVKGLATKKWTRNYSDQRSTDARWSLFHAALRIDRDAAIKATSWGIGQIMGFNYAMAGFANPKAFAKNMHHGEFEQMHAVASFILSQPQLHAAFRDADFQAIARFYNGPGQVKVYANQMKKAFLKSRYFTSPVVARSKARRQGWPRVGSSGDIVRSIQKRLNALGYATDADGDFGRFTEDAVILFQRHNGLEMDGVVGKLTLAALKRAQPLEPNRKPLPEVIKTNTPVQASLATTAIGAVAGIAGLLPEGKTVVQVVTPTEQPQHTAVLQQLTTLGETAKLTEQAVKPIGSLASYVKSHAVISVSAVAIALGLWAFSRSLQAFRFRRWSV